VLPKLPSGVPAKGFGITIENAGGSATPTTPIILSGE
jgi:anti-sigma-K factor RskA